MKGSTLKRAFPIVAAALGRKFGVTVTVEGQAAATNGNHIVLPVLPDDGAVKDVAWGYLAHEAAHIRYTDFATYARSGTSALRGALMNIIEDARIEKSLGHEYPGTRETIGKTVAHVMREGGFDPNIANPAAVLTSHVLLKLRTEVLGQEMLARLARQADEVLRRTFPKGAVTRLHGLLAEARTLASTADSLRLTDSIIKMLKEEQQKERKAQEQASKDARRSRPSGAKSGGKSGEAGSSGPGQVGTQPSASGTGQQADAKPSAEGSGGISGSANSGADRKPAGDGETTETTEVGGLGGRAGDGFGNPHEQAIANALSATPEDIPQDVFTQAADMLAGAASEGVRQYGSVAMPRGVPGANNLARRHEILGEARANSSRLRAQLTGLVQSAREERRWTKRCGRRLDRGRLHRLALGDTRVFVSRSEHAAPNTAVHLLVDVSGSMNDMVPGTPHTRCQLALNSAVALSVALEGIRGVNPAVTAFPGYAHNTVEVLQRHGEPVRLVAGRFDQPPRGGTPMYESLWYGAAQLVAQREPRKLLLVLTDGDPARKSDVKDLVARLEHGGLEIYGIGIATMVVRNLFRRHHVITDVAQLRTALFEIARAALLAA
jgi:cobaltochelatase CobT